MVKLDKNGRPYPVRADGYRDLPTARPMSWFRVQIIRRFCAPSGPEQRPKLFQSNRGHRRSKVLMVCPRTAVAPPVPVAVLPWVTRGS
jgi:hypothetical protein